MSGELFAKVAKLGDSVKEVFLGAGAKIQDALDAAEVDTTGFSVRVNGRAVDLGGALPNNAVITLVPAVKGGRG